MSLSNDGAAGTKNPAKRFIEFKGGDGIFTYYDKDKKENVEIPTPFYVVVLDQLHTVKGWHDDSSSGIYANEVSDISAEKLRVKSFKGGDIVQGLYSDIKGNLQGGKYNKSVYAVMLDGKGKPVEMVNLSLKGASLSSWIDSEVKTDGGIVTVAVDPNQKKKGATKYYVPTFKVSPKKEAIFAECVKFDQELQDYLGKYKQEQSTPTTVAAIEQSVQEAEVLTDGESEEDFSDLPF